MATPNTIPEWIEALQPIPLHDGLTIKNSGLKEIRDYLIQLRDLTTNQQGD